MLQVICSHEINVREGFGKSSFTHLGYQWSSASHSLNQYFCNVIRPKRHRRPLPTGVSASLPTFLGVALIPLIYYGMVIGWGVAVTQSGRSMNHIGRSISLHPVTAKSS